ncbi:MAG: HAD family hydrolase [Nanoarchaeota archaeon]
MSEDNIRSQITHILFDVDGTLYDKNKEYVSGNGTIMDSHEFFRYGAFMWRLSGLKLEDASGMIVAEYQGLAETRKLRSWIDAVPVEIKRLYAGFLQQYGSNGNVFHHRFGTSKSFLACLLEHIDFGSLLCPDDETISAISHLKEQYHLGIITNETYKTTCAVICASGLSLDDFSLPTGTNYPVFCRETGVAKPNPASFQHAIDVLSIDPGKCVYVGDSVEKDVLPAKEVGMRPVLIVYGQDIKERDRYVQIGYLSDLERLLKGDPHGY